MKTNQVIILTAMILLIAALGACTNGIPSGTSTPGEPPGNGGQVACQPGQGEEVTIATAKFFIEYNYTDDDIGVQGMFDDQGWSELCVYDPNGKQVLAVNPQSELKDLTMGVIFFESREPPAEELSFEDLKAQFPEGQYQVLGTSFDGKKLTGSATFTHDVPAAPPIISPAEDAEVSTEDLVIEWQDVTETIDGDPVTITAYEVTITKENHTDPHGFSRPIFDVHVSPDRTALSVPAQFLEPGTEYELEVLALEESGNQTISVSFFTTE